MQAFSFVESEILGELEDGMILHKMSNTGTVCESNKLDV